MKASLVRLVILLMAVIGVAGPHAASATTTEEQAEIAASAAVPAPTGAIGEPVPHPGAIRGTEAIIYFSDFEANNGGLTPSLDWEWGTINIGYS